MTDDTSDPTPPTQGLVRYDIRWYGNGFPPDTRPRAEGVWVTFEQADSLLSALRGELAEARGQRDFAYRQQDELREELAERETRIGHQREQNASVEAKYSAARAALASAREERLRWIVQLLKARDEFVKCDYAEAWHQLYQIASPDFTKLDPWAEFEQEAALAAKEGGEK